MMKRKNEIVIWSTPTSKDNIFWRFFMERKEKKRKIPYEYFCNGCDQLRLSFDAALIGCGNCGSLDTVEGKPLTLDKDTLKKQFKRGEEEKNSG